MLIQIYSFNRIFEDFKMFWSAPFLTLEGKHFELWHNILVWCFDTVTTPLDLEHTLFLCNDKVTRMSAYWRCFAVSNGYAGDGNHPRKLLMHTGSKSGKSRSWVDTSLSLVPR